MTNTRTSVAKIRKILIFLFWNIFVLYYSVYLRESLSCNAAIASPMHAIFGKIMEQVDANKIPPRQFKVEITEIKKSLPLRKVDDGLTEFERARQASKTWSMGQD